MRHETIRAFASAASRFIVSLLALAALAVASADAADVGADATGDGTGQVTLHRHGKVKRIYGIRAVRPGMNQTELQSVLGPPDYIQVNDTRQAWQYCPHFLERMFTRRGDLIQSMEHLFARRDGDFFITVWFDNGQVEHLRAYPEEAMGNCADFYAAFRWDDVIDGEFGGFGALGGYDGYIDK